MPLPDWIIDVSSAPFPPWDAVTEAVANVIRSIAKPDVSGARVYSNWIYDVDVATMLGKVVNEMRATSGADNGKVHCWTVGISSARPEVNSTGDNVLIGGQGARWTWNLTIDFWGLFEYDGTATSQKAAQDEARAVGAALIRNAEAMVQNIEGLASVSMPSYPTVQPQPMSGGSRCVVAQGVIMVSIDEALNV